MIDWLRKVFRLNPPPQLPTDAEVRHEKAIRKGDKVLRVLDDYQRMDTVLVITRKRS